MKFHKILILLFTCSLFLFSCKTDSTNKVNKAKTEQKAKSKKKNTKKAAKNKAKKGTKKKAKKVKLKEAEYWNQAKKSVGLTDQQVASVKQVLKQNNTNMASLKKQNKWKGDANKKSRDNLNNIKTKSLKNIIGDKWGKWATFRKKYAK